MSIIINDLANDISVEDSGCAKILTLANDDNEENGIFVRIQSWDTTKKHNEINKFQNKNVKVTIEIID